MQDLREIEEEKALGAILAFYEVLCFLDIVRMEAVWLQEDWAGCLHPGWKLLGGWEEVQRSWAAIFNSTRQILISISRPFVQTVGDAACMPCLEGVTTAQSDGISTALIEATNIFVRHGGRLQLVHRHGVPPCGKTTSPRNGILQ